MHDEILALGQNTAFNMIYETQQRVSAFAFNEIRTPLIHWSAERTRITIEGQTLDLDAWRAGLKLMEADAWALIDDIVGGKRLGKFPDAFQDNLPKDTRSYGFLSHGPFTDEPHPLLTHIMTKAAPLIAVLDARDRLSWNLPKVHEYMCKFAELNQLLSVLCFVQPTISSRVVSFLDKKYRNRDRHRNLIVIDKDMVRLDRYSKTTNLTESDKCIPAFYPNSLKALMLEYLAGGIRETETVFTALLYRAEEVDSYHL